MNNVFLFLFCISFLCIPVFIIWALINLFRKKSAKKRFVWAGISALLLVISLVGFGVTMDKTIQSIELSISDYQSEYDINAEIPVNILVSPEYADTSSLEYLSNGNTLTFSATGILTGAEEGSFNIYVKSGDITSNILTVNVTDFTAREEAKNMELAKAEEEEQKLAKEQAAKEAEQKRVEEENAAKEAEQKRIEEENAAKEAEQKRIDAENAAKEAEQKRIEEENAAKEAEQKRIDAENAAKEAEQKRVAEENAAKEAEQKKVEEENAAKETEQKQMEEAAAKVDEQAQTQISQEATTQSSTSSAGNGNNFDTYNNPEQQRTSDTYVLNTKRHKIHYPSCSSVPKIASQNYATSSASITELEGQGYTTCGICFK